MRSKKDPWRIKIIEDEFTVQGYTVHEKYYACPRCKKAIGNVRDDDLVLLSNRYKYCFECGQSLDWRISK